MTNKCELVAGDFVALDSPPFLRGKLQYATQDRLPEGSVRCIKCIIDNAFVILEGEEDVCYGGIHFSYFRKVESKGV